jgi:hypothetical protein
MAYVGNVAGRMIDERMNVDFPGYNPALFFDTMPLVEADMTSPQGRALWHTPTPTWTFPYVCAETKLGSLGTMPVDLFSFLITRLPICDVARLRIACRTFSQILGSACSPYTPLLPLMGHALMTLANRSEISDVLRSIERLPVSMRAEPLRTFSSQLKVSGIVTYGNDLSVHNSAQWTALIGATRAHLHNVCNESDRAQHNINLDIAEQHTALSSVIIEGAAFYDTLYSRLKTYPVRYWLDFLDAAVPRINFIRSFQERDLRLLFADDTIRYPGMSNTLALAFANACAPLMRGPMNDMLRTRFGVTPAQFAEVLHPAEALEIDDWREFNDIDIRTLWQRHPGVDSHVAALAERIGFEGAAARFFENGRRWKSKWSPGLSVFTNEMEATQWYLRVSGAFSDVVNVVRSRAEVSAPMRVPPDELVDAYMRLTHDMADGANALRCLSWLKTQPLICQPILMDRWAALLKRESYDTSCLDVLESIADWREKTVVALRVRNQDNNAARAYVAEMRAREKMAIEMIDVTDISADKALATRFFDTMPITSWGAMLDYLASYDGLEECSVGKQMLTRYTATFLMCPSAGASYTSTDFSLLLGRTAARIFSDLPDKADSQKTKYAQFCSRFSIRMALREDIRIEVLSGIGDSIPLNPRGMRTAIRAALKTAGIHDHDSFVTVLGLQHSALREATNSRYFDNIVQRS